MITINNIEYKVKYSIRALFIWEQLSKKPFKLETFLDNYVLYYSMILASNPDCNLTFDEFIDATDKNPSLITSLAEELAKSEKINSQFTTDDEEEDSEKKE